MYSWAISLSDGSKGVRLVAALLRMKPETMDVVDVQNDSQYQAQDIDIVWRKRDPTGHLCQTGIEVKWDTYTSGNFAFETVSVVETAKPGCFLESQADLWYYWFPNFRCIYVLPLLQTRTWYLANANHYQRKTTSTRKGGTRWNTEFAVVPINDVLNNVDGVETIPVDRTIL